MRKQVLPSMLAVLLGGTVPTSARNHSSPMQSANFNVEAAQRFARLALACVHKEYPNKLTHSLNSDADVAPRFSHAAQAGNSTAPEYTFKVIHAFPHDPAAYTQGLVYHAGFLYEGTGLYGHSSLRKVRLETGKVLQQVNLAPEFFGEGITIFRDKILQLTWKDQTGFIYKLSDFHKLGQFSYSGEGWGLATDGQEIFMSDGTAQIRILDGNTLRETRRITVHDGDTTITQLNELEFVRGEIFANVWQTDRIARISPQNGKVTGWIDLSGLLSPIFRRDPDAVLNGIAYDPTGKRLFVTGKLWPRIFQIELAPKNPANIPKS